MTISDYANRENLNNIIILSQLIQERKSELNFIDEDKYRALSGIYKIENLVNGNVYIGQTKQKFIKRYWHHAWKLKNNTHDNRNLQSDYNLFDSNEFSFSVLKVVDDDSNIDRLEQEYIKSFRDICKCYNIQNGGQKNGNNYIRTPEIKRSIGEKNKIHMLGRKHSEETKRKMSLSRTGKHYNKHNYKLNDELAFKIKTLLIKGFKAKEVSEMLCVDYKSVNNILSSNSWKDVKVDGWENFRNNRSVTKRLKEDDYVEILKLYNEGLSIIELAEKYERTTHAIRYAIRKMKD